MKLTFEYSLDKNRLISLFKDFLCVPNRWVYNTAGKKITLNLPDEHKEEIQREIYEWLKRRLNVRK